MKVRRTALLLLAGLALGELFYVGAFEWAARSGRLERWINRRPDKAQLTFRNAHSWFPFRIALEGLDLAVQTPRLQWRLKCDEVSGWIAPAPLLARRCASRISRRHGCRVPAAPPRDSPPDTAVREEHLPPMPAFPLAGTPPLSRPAGRAWNFEFPRVRATASDISGSNRLGSPER